MLSASKVLSKLSKFRGPMAWPREGEKRVLLVSGASGCSPVRVVLSPSSLVTGRQYV